MYQEQIAQYTADHLRTHIGDYLADIFAEFTGQETIELVLPKRIERASVVGGLWTEFDSILPQYGVDILTKSPSSDDASLWTYEYPGQINGMVMASSRDVVDKLCDRHERAVEFFIRQHQFLHNYETENFRMIELVFGTVDFSGAEDVSSEGVARWLAGFSINASWFVSEEGPQQHG